MMAFNESLAYSYYTCSVNFRTGASYSEIREMMEFLSNHYPSRACVRLLGEKNRFKFHSLGDGDTEINSIAYFVSERLAIKRPLAREIAKPLLFFKSEEDMMIAILAHPEVLDA